MTFALLALLLLTSCGGGGNSFETLNDILSDKFGTDAYYKNVAITPVPKYGDIVNITVTSDPSSMQLEEWTYLKGSWEKKTIVTIEMEGEGSMKDFLYQLDNEVSISKLGELVELSKVSLTKEKNIENPALMTAMMNCPDYGGKENLEYQISITPEHGGTSFNYHYDLNGELKDMNY